MIFRSLLCLLLVAGVFGAVDPRRPWKGPSYPEKNCNEPRCIPSLNFAQTQSSQPLAKYVLVVGIDGMGGYYLRNMPSKYSTPNMQYLRDHGAYTFFTRQVMPTISKPNWMTIISGAGPEEHGVLDNDWVVGTQWEPLTGNGTYFPSIFSAIKQQVDMKIAVYNDWSGFNDLFPHTSVDFLANFSDPDANNLTQSVIRDIISTQAAQFIFLHYDDVDEAGHSQGWGTDAYYRAIELVDAQIGKLLQALEAAGILNQTLLVVTSDHGGEGTSHGETDTLNMYTQLIFHGPGIRSGYAMPCPTRGNACFGTNGRNIRTIDLAPTIMNVLGLQSPDLWIGRVLSEVFL